MKIGMFDGETTKVFKVEENEQVIGIQTHTLRDPKSFSHGALYNLQFKIAKLI
jgi:hypothetical protein